MTFFVKDPLDKIFDDKLEEIDVNGSISDMLNEISGELQSEILVDEDERIKEDDEKRSTAFKYHVECAVKLVRPELSETQREKFIKLFETALQTLK